MERTARGRTWALVGAMVAIGLLVALLGLVGGDRDEAGPEPTPSTSPTDPTPPAADEEPGGRVLVEGTQPEWDPRRVEDLPAAPAGTVAGLPATVTAPPSAPALADSPLDAAVLGIQREESVLLLGTDGSWRSVPLSAEHPRTALSPAGTSLAVWAYGDPPGAEVTVHDVTTGTSTAVPYPAGFRPWDFQTWVWLDDATLLLDDGRGGWEVDVATGRAARVPGPSVGPWTLAADGSLVEVTDFGRPAVLVDRAGGGERRVRLRASGRLARLQADADTVVGTSYDERPFSVIVADRETVTPTAVLPIRDTDANWSNGGLGVLALRADGTVLLRVADLRRGGAYVVSWDPPTGDLALVSHLRKRLGEGETLAMDALRG